MILVGSSIGSDTLNDQCLASLEPKNHLKLLKWCVSSFLWGNPTPPQISKTSKEKQTPDWLRACFHVLCIQPADHLHITWWSESDDHGFSCTLSIWVKETHHIFWCWNVLDEDLGTPLTNQFWDSAATQADKPLLYSTLLSCAHFWTNASPSLWLIFSSAFCKRRMRKSCRTRRFTRQKK